MLKAVRIHSGWTSFLSMAEAYISGQLQCQPINEAYLMERFVIKLTYLFVYLLYRPQYSAIPPVWSGTNM